MKHFIHVIRMWYHNLALLSHHIIHVVSCLIKSHEYHIRQYHITLHHIVGLHWTSVSQDAVSSVSHHVVTQCVIMTLRTSNYKWFDNEVQYNISFVGRCGAVGSTLAFGSIGHGLESWAAYFHITAIVHQLSASRDHWRSNYQIIERILIHC